VHSVLDPAATQGLLAAAVAWLHHQGGLLLLLRAQVRLAPRCAARLPPPRSVAPQQRAA
jgi:hypothetical protein